MTDTSRTKSPQARMSIPARVGEDAEVNYGKAPPADFGPLARDRIPVRAMKEVDLRALVDIDRRITGRNRSDYFNRKLEEALYELDVRVSLVAERTASRSALSWRVSISASLAASSRSPCSDTIGVDPEYRKQGIGRALISQLFMNLITLRVEGIRTVIGWSDEQLVTFFDRCGFRPSQRLCLELATK